MRKANPSHNRKYTPGFNGEVLKCVHGSSVAFNEDFKDWMFSLQEGLCGYCGESMGETWRENRNAQVVHVHNRRNGGEDLPPNLVYACRSCNMMKNRLHYSSLKLRIPMRRAGINGLISPSKCQKLIEMGLISITPLEKVFFEEKQWPHVKGYSLQEIEELSEPD